MATSNKPSEEAVKMRRFIHEYVLATGVDGRNALAKVSPELPPCCGPHPTPTVTLPRQELVRFRNGYQLLLEFAALKCGRPIEELCPLDLMTVWPFPVDPDDEDFS
jgi:hypothetical protein